MLMADDKATRIPKLPVPDDEPVKSPKFSSMNPLKYKRNGSKQEPLVPGTINFLLSRLQMGQNS